MARPVWALQVAAAPLSAPSQSLAQRPVCSGDKERKQALLSLPALVPQTVYRYCGDEALLHSAWLESGVIAGKVINAGPHSTNAFVRTFFLST